MGMDVIQIEKTGEYFRIIYDVKGRFTVHRITAKEAMYKLCKVRETKTGPNGVPYLYTSDGRTIRYPDPIIKVHDSIQVDIATGKILDTIKFDSGNLCMITGGRNTARIGYVFIIGKGSKAYISLPKGKGVKLSIAEERDKTWSQERLNIVIFIAADI